MTAVALDDLFTIEQIASEYPNVGKNTFRFWICNRESNGFAKCIVDAGLVGAQRRFLISKQRLVEWLSGVEETPDQLPRGVEKIETITGIYFLLNDEGRVVYVGKSINVHRRLDEHRKSDKHFSDVRVLRCPESKLSSLEAQYIREFRPIYNMTSF